MKVISNGSMTTILVKPAMLLALQDFPLNYAVLVWSLLSNKILIHHLTFLIIASSLFVFT